MSLTAVATDVLRDAARYQQWPREALDRIAAAFVALNPIALGEIRAGYRARNWGAARIAHMENQLRSYVLIPLADATLDACRPARSLSGGRP